MTDEPFTTPGRKIPTRAATPGERLFACVRASDRAPMSCELRDHGVYGWEAQFLERGDLFYARGGFATRAQAVQWAEEERKAIESGTNA
jgi:hypothetical protein